MSLEKYLVNIKTLKKRWLPKDYPLDLRLEPHEAIEEIETTAEELAILNPIPVQETEKISNVTHTGDVTGSEELLLESSSILRREYVTPSKDDLILISDASDAGNLKKIKLDSIISEAVSIGIVEFETTESTPTTTTSPDFTVMKGMSLTPSAGSYRVIFSGTGELSRSPSSLDIAIYVDEKEDPSSLRSMATNHNKQKNMRTHIFTTAKIKVNGNQTIELRWSETNRATATAHERSLVAIRIAS